MYYICRVPISDFFYFINQQITKLTLQSLTLGPETSKQCATGVFTMKSLKSLEVIGGKVDNLFFSPC